MPQLNQKGPEGAGARTGRKMGRCSKRNSEASSEIGLTDSCKRRQGRGQNRNNGEATEGTRRCMNGSNQGRGQNRGRSNNSI